MQWSTIPVEAITQEQREINDFVYRSFRDTADQDYIAARLCYRHRLVQQFLWMSLQCLEIYLKGILVLNGCSAKSGHDLEAALAKCELLPFFTPLPDDLRRYVSYFNNYGHDRYLVFSHHIRGSVLHQLDILVWHIRRYCQALNYYVLQGDDLVFMGDRLLRRIESCDPHDPRTNVNLRGKLEKILADRNSTQRPALIWKNFRFGSRKRNKLRVTNWFEGTNSPLSLRPELYDKLDKLVTFPPEAKRVFGQQAR